MEPTKRFIEDLIANELAYINTKHPDFSDARQQVAFFTHFKFYKKFRLVVISSVEQATESYNTASWQESKMEKSPAR